MTEGEIRYDDKQAARIIKRALEIQKREYSGETGDIGLSLRELEGIGRDSGIDPSLIRRAAEELSDEALASRERLARAFYGRPTRSRVGVDSPARVSRESLDALLLLLPSITGDSGTGSIAGDTLHWTSNALLAVRLGRSTSITVSPAPVGTEVRLESNLGSMAGGLFAGLIGGVGLGGGLGVGLGVGLTVLGSPLFAALVPFGFLAAAWLLSRGVFGLAVRYRSSREDHIVGTIRRTLERHRVSARLVGE